MTMIAGAKAGRGVRRPAIPTPETPSFRGAACAEPGAARDWRTTLVDQPLHQRSLVRDYCDRCPIAEMCLTQALERGETTGVWGGLTSAELERALALKNGRVPKKTTPAPAAAESEPVALGVAA